MNWKKQEEHVKTIARYFEVHENELWSEILPILSQSHQQGRMEMAEEILKTKFELNVDGNLFEVINPDIVSKMVTPPTINK